MINWSSRIGQLFNTDFSAFFVTFTNDSQAPYIHGLLGGMKSHWIFQIDKLLVIGVWSKSFSKNFNSRFVPTKFWPLSLHMLLGLSRLDVNLTARKTVFPRFWNIIESSKRPSKYYLYINFLAKKIRYFPFPKRSKQELFSNQ